MAKHIHVLIKPASSLCNLRCKYCFYADVSDLRAVKSYGRMKPATTEAMITNIFADLDDGDELSLMFQGGEPTMAGLHYYEHLVACVAEQTAHVKVHYAIQTNGIVINDRWCIFLKKYEFLVGLSIDGLPMYHDMNRLDTRGRGTFGRVIHTKQMFDHYQIEYNVLCVLTNQLARNATKVFNFLKKEHIAFVQFIPCLDDLETPTPTQQFALEPRRFANFYTTLFYDWLNAFENGQYISIKLFDDMYNLYVRHQITACGINGQCTVQYVIEADGSVYPCDFYVLDEYRLGYIQNQTLKELFNQPIATDWITQKRTLPDYCDECPFRLQCCGGCKRMASAMYVDKNGDFCGFKTISTLFVNNIDRIQAANQRLTAVTQGV